MAEGHPAEISVVVFVPDVLPAPVTGIVVLPLSGPSSIFEQPLQVPDSLPLVEAHTSVCYRGRLLQAGAQRTDDRRT